MISISLLQKDIEIHDCPNDTVLSKHDLTRLAGGYQQLYEQNKLQLGDRIALCMQEDSHHLAALFGAIDMGLVPVVSGIHYYDDEYCNNANIKFVFTRGIQPVTVETKTIPHLEITDVEPTSDYTVSHNDILFEAMTSGSTGKPKIISHTHSSVESSADDSIKWYWNKDSETWFFHNIVHLGVSSVYFFPALANSKRMILPPMYDTFDNETWKKYNVNMMLLFPSHYESYPWIENMDFSNVEYVLTGGATIPKSFCERCLSQGAKKIAVIYGLTECLPPIIHKIVTKDNIDTYDESSMGINCDDSALYSINKRNELVVQSSKHLATQINYQDVEQLHTGDCVDVVGDTFYFTKRNKDLIRVNDALINPQQLVPEELRTHVVLFSTSPTHVVVCIDSMDHNTNNLESVLMRSGIDYDKLHVEITLNVLGKPDISKLRNHYDSVK